MATSVNVTESIKNSKKGRALKKQKQALKKDLCEIIYYNYDKKEHYLNTCLKTLKLVQKTGISFGNFFVNDWC